MTRRTCAGVVASVLALALSGVGLGGGPAYAVQDLGSFGSVTSTHAYAINESGVVVGDALNNSLALRAFRSSDGPLVDLGESPGEFSRAFGVSAFGVVAGWHDADSGASQASLWLSPDERVPLATPGGLLGSQASDVNGARLAVGHVISAVGDLHPYSWLPDGTPVPLSEGVGLASSVNESGVVVGRVVDGGVFRGVRWSGVGGALNEALLASLGSGDAWAEAVSNTGVIVGSAWSDEDGLEHAVRWDAGGITDLGATGDGLATRALGVNDGGQVVGSGDGPAGGTRAMLWTPEGEAHDLNELIAEGSAWTLRVAQDINNGGVIVGWGVRSDLPGERGFVLTPIAPDCPADLSGDGVVDSADLNVVLAAFGAVGQSAGDVDGDGDTDSADLNGLLAAFGLSCGQGG